MFNFAMRLAAPILLAIMMLVGDQSALVAQSRMTDAQVQEVTWPNTETITGSITPRLPPDPSKIV